MARQRHRRAGFSFELPAQWTLARTVDHPPSMTFTAGSGRLIVSAEPLLIAEEHFAGAVLREMLEEGFTNATIADRLPLGGAVAATIDGTRGIERRRVIAAVRDGIGYRVRYDGPDIEESAAAFAVVRTSFHFPESAQPEAFAAPPAHTPSRPPTNLGEAAAAQFHLPVVDRSPRARLRRFLRRLLRALHR